MTIRLACAAALGLAMVATACAPEDDAPKATPAAATAQKALAMAAADPALVWGPCPPLFSGECAIAVLHGDPAGANADVFLRVGPKSALPAHWHTSAERMVLVTGTLEVKYQGQPPATLAVGDYAYGPAKAPHSGNCTSDTACTLFIAFESAVDAHAFEGSLE